MGSDMTADDKCDRCVTGCVCAACDGTADSTTSAHCPFWQALIYWVSAGQSQHAQQTPVSSPSTYIKSKMLLWNLTLSLPTKLTLWCQNISVNAMCGAEKTKCHLKSSAKNMESNGHFNPAAFAEYTGHIVLAPQGEYNVAPVTKVTYKVMIHAGQTLHKLAVTIMVQGGNKYQCLSDLTVYWYKQWNLIM